jgi:hypothetical protein
MSQAHFIFTCWSCSTSSGTSVSSICSKEIELKMLPCSILKNKDIESKLVNKLAENK